MEQTGRKIWTESSLYPLYTLVQLNTLPLWIFGIECILRLPLLRGFVYAFHYTVKVPIPVTLLMFFHNLINGFYWCSNLSLNLSNCSVFIPPPHPQDNDPKMAIFLVLNSRSWIAVISADLLSEVIEMCEWSNLLLFIRIKVFFLPVTNSFEFNLKDGIGVLFCSKIETFFSN